MSGKRKIERSLEFTSVITSKYADFDGGVGTRPPDLDDDVCDRYQLVLSCFNTVYYSIIDTGDGS